MMAQQRTRRVPCCTGLASLVALLVACGEGFLDSGGEIDDFSGAPGFPTTPGAETPPPLAPGDTGSGPNGGQSPDFDEGPSIDVPDGLTPNGDGTYSDARGTRVRFNAQGQLVDEQGNPVIVGADGIVVPLNPELEVETSFRVPVVTGRLIWAANPASGRVALVDALTHQVETLPAGLSPTYLAAIPGDTGNRALVINSGSSDATLFRDGAGGELEQTDIDLHQGATAWALSADGRWAIAWSDARDFGVLDPTEGLQDVTLIDLAASPPAPQRFSVGYRPVKVEIDSTGSRAYAVTRDGISVIELGDAPALSDDITLVSPDEELSGAAGDPVLDDVPITPDGRYALVRFEGAPRLKVIDLAANASRVLTLPGEVSDVDVSSDGTRAIAVIRDTAQVAVFSPEAAFSSDEVVANPPPVTLRNVTGETLGSAALPEAGDKALLFTNAIASDRLAILDVADAAASPRVVSLKAPITAVFPSPDGSHAVALLSTEPTSERKGAFSIVPVDAALPPKIQGTDSPPYRVSVAETSVGLRALVTTRDDTTGVHAAYLVRMPSLQVDRIDLPSPPLAVGVLPEHGIGYVAQQHPEGRITFIDLETAAPQTLTGFELAERVVDGAR